jgi:hypothetical protein
MPLIIPANSITGGYEVANSLRFDDGSSDYLSRTPASAGNRKTWTWSGWVKRGNITLGIPTTIFAAGPNSSSPRGIIDFDNTDQLRFGVNDGTWYIASTTALFRDPSAWYHIVAQIDFSNATQSDRVKLYVNNVLQTTNSVSWPSTDQVFNNNVSHQLGRNQLDGSSYLDGYLSEVCFIDGQALDPTSFGEFDEDTGIWKPISVSGLTFGTNGFYLDFENSGSLGADVSGNGNNFTVNNLTSIDQTTDTPTNNFATMNPLVFNTSTGNTFAEGNLQVSTTDSARFGAVPTIGVSSGKWYMEVKPTQIQNKMTLGVTSSASQDAKDDDMPGTSTNAVGLRSSGDAQTGGIGITGSWDSFTTSDIIGIALDLDNNNLYFSKNGTFMNSADPTSGATGTGAISLTDPASTTDGFYFFAFGDPGAGAGTSNIAQFNFGNPPFTISSGNSDGNGYGNFEYAPPSGYYALNTKNLAEFG